MTEPDELLDDGGGDPSEEYLASISRMLSRQLIDNEGYPTDEALEGLGTFDGTADEMADYVGRLMHNGSARVEDYVDDFKLPGKRLTLVTGGWTGCESVISGLQETMFHIVGWESSARGGKHTYTFTLEQWDSVFPWGIPGKSTTTERHP